MCKQLCSLESEMLYLISPPYYTLFSMTSNTLHMTTGIPLRKFSSCCYIINSTIRVNKTGAILVVLIDKMSFATTRMCHKVPGETSGSANYFKCNTIKFQVKLLAIPTTYLNATTLLLREPPKTFWNSMENHANNKMHPRLQ